MRVRYFFYILLVSAAIAIQWPLWFGKGGISRMHALEAELTSIRESNDRLRAENDAVAAEIESLESGTGRLKSEPACVWGWSARTKFSFDLSPRAKRKMSKPV